MNSGSWDGRGIDSLLYIYMRCSLTQDVVVIVARAFIAVDTTGKYRRIYSPGSMVPFGFIFMHGTPKEVTISGTELTSTLHGPSTQAYIFDPIGHAIVCPPIGKGLVALSILDSTDPELVEIIQEATEHEVMLLVQIGANRGHNGVVDPDFFNPEEIQRDFHNSNSVLSIAVNIQRPLSSQTSSRRVFQRPIHVPVIDPMLSAEDLGVSTSKYGTELAKIMSKIERLHMAAAEDFLKHDEEFLKGGRLDAQTAHDKVQQVLTILQELGDGLGDDGEGHAQSLNQLQECAVQAGFGSNLPTHLQPEKLLGFPGILDPSSTEVAAFQHGREDPMHLPYLGVPTEEFHHRIQSLNHSFCEYQHFESKENAELSFCEVNTSGSLQPLGQTHIWIGKPSVVFFNLLYSDRRAHIHVFTEAPVTEIYSLVNADMWCQFTVHRIQESNISTNCRLGTYGCNGSCAVKGCLIDKHAFQKRPSSGTPLCLGTARWRMQAVWWLLLPKLFGPGARAIEGWTPSGHTPAVCEPPHSGACPLYVFPAKWSAKCYAPPNSGSAGAVVDRLCLRLSSASGCAHRKNGDLRTFYALAAISYRHAT